LPSTTLAPERSFQPADPFSSPALSTGVYWPSSPQGRNGCESCGFGRQSVGFMAPAWAGAAAKAAAAAARAATASARPPRFEPVMMNGKGGSSFVVAGTVQPGIGGAPAAA